MDVQFATRRISMLKSLFHTLRSIMHHPLNQKEKVGALLRYLRWQLGSRIVDGEIVYDWVGGARLLLRAGERGPTGNIYSGLHEYSHMSYVLHIGLMSCIR